jgi:hypothetical protein
VAGKILLLLDSDSEAPALQPVGSRNTDWAIPARRDTQYIKIPV